MRRSRRFVSFEGIDGSGKSTQAALFAEALETEGHGVVRTREPGGTALGEALRRVLLESEGGSIGALAEMHLFAAARAQLVEEVVAPTLAGGGWVVADRFLDSSLAYQGAARGIGIERVMAANATAVDHHMPALTIVIDLDPDQAAHRRGGRADRIEGEDDDFHARVAAGYRELARRFPIRLCRIAGEGTPQQVHERVMAATAGLRAAA
jgi:dTMP kinase